MAQFGGLRRTYLQDPFGIPHVAESEADENVDTTLSREKLISMAEKIQAEVCFSKCF